MVSFSLLSSEYFPPNSRFCAIEIGDFPRKFTNFSSFDKTSNHVYSLLHSFSDWQRFASAIRFEAWFGNCLLKGSILKPAEKMRARSRAQNHQRSVAVCRSRLELLSLLQKPRRASSARRVRSDRRPAKPAFRTR